MADLAARLARRRPFYGWYVVGVEFLVGFFRVGYTGFLFGVFLKPMAEEFGWSRATVTGAVTLGTLVAGTVGYLFGRTLDRSGPRAMVAGAAVVMGLSFLALAGTQSVLWYYLAYAVGRAVAQSALGEPMVAAVVAKWFVRLRGRAIAIASTGGPLGGALLAVVTERVIAAAGWRVAWATFGGYALLLVAPAALLLLRRSPEDLGLRPDGDAGPAAQASGTRPLRARPDVSLTFPRALRTRSFWLLSLVGGLGSLTSTGVSFHLVPRFTDVGVHPAAAAGAVGLYTLAQAVAMLGWGFAAERLPVRWALVAVLGAGAGGTFLVARAASVGEAYLAVVVYGSAMGGWFQLMQVAWADYFGRQHLGSIRGLSLFFQLVGNALGAFVSALVYDVTGDYRAAFLLYVGVLGCCAGAIALAAPPRRVGAEAPQAALR